MDVGITQRWHPSELGDCRKHRTMKGRVGWGVGGGDEIVIVQAGDEIVIRLENIMPA